MDNDFGHPLRDGLLSQATEPEVSAVPASIPDACEYCDNTGICGWDAVPQFCGQCSHGKSALNGWQAATTKRRPVVSKYSSDMQSDLRKLSVEMQAGVREQCNHVCRVQAKPGQPIWPCVDKNHACFRCQMLAAKAIEARSGETARLVGDSHESAVAKPFAQTLPPSSTERNNV